jgi:uncharacterized protein DUF1524
VDLSVTTIEHVLPQTLTDVWQQELGSEAQRIYDELVDTIGSLTPTAYNSEQRALSAKRWNTTERG